MVEPWSKARKWGFQWERLLIEANTKEGAIIPSDTWLLKLVIAKNLQGQADVGKQWRTRMRIWILEFHGWWTYGYIILATWWTLDIRMRRSHKWLSDSYPWPYNQKLYRQKWVIVGCWGWFQRSSTRHSVDLTYPVYLLQTIYRHVIAVTGDTNGSWS